MRGWERQQRVHASKTQSLSADDIAEEHLKRHVALALDRLKRDTRLAPPELSVMDVGCGRGAEAFRESRL